MRTGEIVADRFVVEELAGEGGMGSVYRARDGADGRIVAIKVLHDALAVSEERLVREAQVLAELKHPAIVRYLSHGTTQGGDRFLAMEWVEGEDLAQRLERGQLGVRESLSFARGVAEALGVAHARGVVHRDIKPANVLLRDSDLAQPKLLDFGIARRDQAFAKITGTGLVLGTPGYMAPEQARGEATIDARADVFSLGCVLFECLTGRPPFVADQLMALLAKVALEDAPRLRELVPGIDERIDDLVARMLAKSADDRPADGTAVAVELAALEVVEALPSQVRPRRISEMPPSLSDREQRVVSVVATKATMVSPSSPGDRVLAPTMSDEQALEVRERLRATAEAFGARLEVLADGSAFAVSTGRGGGAELAANAARCALAMFAKIGGDGVVLATGRAVVGDRLPLGEVIDRAARMLRKRQASEAIPIDEVTAGLLDARFEVIGDASGLVLVREREVFDTTRTLLGRATPCVGRDRELAMLEGIVSESLSEGIANAVVVIGAPGVGKSRLRHELLARATCKSIETWVARSDELMAGAPLGVLSQLVRRAAGIVEGEPIESRRLKLRARVARHVSASEVARVTVFLGEMIGARFPDASSEQLVGARDDAILMGDQMRRAFEEFVEAECRAQPLLIVLEDLHWGDLASVKHIDAMLERARDLPFVVLAFARPEVSDAFPELFRTRRLHTLNVPELSPRAAERLVRAVLAESIDAETIARLVDRAAGNAFYLEELIRAVAEAKGDALPDSVLAMVQARIDRLPASARQVLRAASVFGGVFWRGGVMALVGGAARTMRTGQWLDELCEREVIAKLGSPRFPGEQEFAFRHILVREAAYAMLTEQDRTLGHRLAATWLKAAGESEASVLAEHFERGGEQASAIDEYRRAAEQALGANDFAATLARVEKGVSCGAEGAVLGTLRRLQSEAHRWRGDMKAFSTRSEEALELLPRGTIEWCFAIGERAAALNYAGDHDALERLSQLFCSLDPEACTYRHLSPAAQMVLALTRGARLPAADRVLEWVSRVEARVAIDDPLIAARLLRARGYRAHFAGDESSYLRLSEAALEHFERIGAVRDACSAVSVIGYANIIVGGYARAEELLRGSLASALRLGLRPVAIGAKHNLGWALFRLGRIDEARVMESEACDDAHATGAAQLEVVSRRYLAEILISAGDFEGARDQLDRALSLASDSGRVHVLLGYAMLHLAAGRLDEALRDSGEAMAAIERHGGVEEGEAALRLVRAEALFRAGRTDEARVAILDAKQRLLARAERLTDVMMREQLLANVPEHARTLALAEEWRAG